MSLVNIEDVIVLNNPTEFMSSFQFQIKFRCLQELPHDLDWKLTYVGNAESSEGDQVLDEICVGPVGEGIHMFVFQTPPPCPDKIKNRDLIGVTVILLSCSYLEKQFVQIGYYINNEYLEPFEPENYPNPVRIDLLRRTILADEPRVTRFAIDWTGQLNGTIDTPPIDQADINEAAQYEEENENENDGNIVDMNEEDDDDEDDDDDEEEDKNDEGEIDIDIEDEDDDDDEDEDDDGDEEDDDEDEEVNDEGGSMEDGDPEVENIPQYMINEESMDVGRMQVEFATHSYTGRFDDI